MLCQAILFILGADGSVMGPGLTNNADDIPAQVRSYASAAIIGPLSVFAIVTAIIIALIAKVWTR
ncbi:MAG: hypothetical protein KC708_15990 [Anaerolineae bacterium]|nr:hypothetical protein [Anaerolineae bacterium]